MKKQFVISAAAEIVQRFMIQSDTIFRHVHTAAINAASSFFTQE
jgi:hypothetical protein